MHSFLYNVINYTPRKLCLWEGILFSRCPSERKSDRADVLTNGIYEAMFSYFGYLCGYFPLHGLDTQQKTIATKISNLRNKSHLDTKMNTSVSNCPNL